MLGFEALGRLALGQVTGVITAVAVSAGVASPSVVGGKIAQAVAASAGAGNNSVVGRAIGPAVAASAGVATDQATGAKVAAGVAASAGLAADAGAGGEVAQAVGASSGVAAEAIAGGAIAQAVATAGPIDAEPGFEPLGVLALGQGTRYILPSATAAVGAEIAQAVAVSAGVAGDTSPAAGEIAQAVAVSAATSTAAADGGSINRAVAVSLGISSSIVVGDRIVTVLPVFRISGGPDAPLFWTRHKTRDVHRYYDRASRARFPAAAAGSGGSGGSSSGATSLLEAEYANLRAESPGNRG